MKLKLYFIFLVLFIISLSCEKEELSENNIVSEALVSSENEEIHFCPSYEVKVENGMLVFDSKIALDVTLNEILSADNKKVDEWYQEMGIETFFSIFNRVVQAEDSISDYLWSLPEKEQANWKNQPEYHSAEYAKAISDGIIIESQDEEDGLYNYNIVDKTVATVINKERLVQIAGKIHQYNENSIILLDKENINLLKSKNLELNKKAIVITYDDCDLKSVNSSYDWTQESDFKKSSRKHRAKFWIEGHSEMVIHEYDGGGWSRETCSDYIDCTFYLRILCQKKNFWGKWIYESDVPTTTIDAQWNYNYGTYEGDPYITYGCGLYDRDVDFVQSYSCSPSPTSICPTSPISNLVLCGNNYYKPVTPHGRWHTATAYFFSHPFEVHGSASATISGISDSFDYSW